MNTRLSILLLIAMTSWPIVIAVREHCAIQAKAANEHAFVLQMDYMDDKFRTDDAELSNDRAEYLAHPSDMNAFILMANGDAVEKDMKQTLKVYHEHFPKPAPTDAERYRTP